jgi:hypothetical protein
VGAAIDPSATVGVDGNITVQSLSAGDANAESLGVNAGAAAIGVAYSESRVSPSITTQVGAGTSLDAGGNITVQSLHNYDESFLRLRGEQSTADSTSGAGGLLGGTGSDSNAHASPTVLTTIAGGSGTTIHAGGALTVQSYVSNDAQSSSLGVAIG